MATSAAKPLYIHWSYPGIKTSDAMGKAAYAAWTKEELKRQGHPDGRPATYDTRIDNEWNPSLSIRKGWAGRS